MAKQTVHIIDFEILYNIFDEIKDYLEFQIFHYKNEENFLNTNNLNLNDSLILGKAIFAPKSANIDNDERSGIKTFNITND